jgi:hypothetical protein
VSALEQHRASPVRTADLQVVHYRRLLATERRQQGFSLELAGQTSKTAFVVAWRQPTMARLFRVLSPISAHWLPATQASLFSTERVDQVVDHHTEDCGSDTSIDKTGHKENKEGIRKRRSQRPSSFPSPNGSVAGPGWSSKVLQRTGRPSRRHDTPCCSMGLHTVAAPRRGGYYAVIIGGPLTHAAKESHPPPDKRDFNACSSGSR